MGGQSVIAASVGFGVKAAFHKVRRKKMTRFPHEFQSVTLYRTWQSYSTFLEIRIIE